jgi:hypothetical protein
LKLGDRLLDYIVKPKQLGSEHRSFTTASAARHRLVAGDAVFQFTFNDPRAPARHAGIGTAMRVHPTLLVPDPWTLNEERL